MVTETNESQPINALESMVVTLLGMVTEVRPVHPSNALEAMVVTLLGTI